MRSLSFFSCLLVLAGAICACNQQSKNKVAVADSSAAKPQVHNAGVKIAYTDTGKNDTTLLFVHGWGINKSYWQNQIDAFGRQYRIVAMDMAGFGESGRNRNRWDTQSFANDVDSVISQLRLNKVILIGHSMAGDIVLQAVIDNEDKVIGVIGVDNFKGPGTPVTPQEEQQYVAAINQLKTHFKASVAEWFNKELFYKTTSRQVRRRIMADVDRADSAIAIASLLDTTFHELPKLQQAKKTLYVIGSDVHPVDTTYMAKAKIPFKLYYVHATGHYPMIEKPAEFNRLLWQVLNDIRKDKQANY